MSNALEEVPLDEKTRENVEKWLNGDYDEESKSEIRRLAKEDPKALTDAFYTTLSFGTGGIRGVMGVGCNRMNVYTVRSSTQGLANYLKRTGNDRSVVIGFDCRMNSQTFAAEAARVLAANGISAYVFKELRPTPLVSFACRKMGASAAIMITASHNPPEYNGYKVYWADGGQIVPPHDGGILKEVANITDISQVKLADLDDSHIHPIGEAMDQKYFDAIEELQAYPEENRRHGSELKVIYSSLHGTGITLVPEALRQWGFSSLTLVDRQSEPDGTFPTVKSPNPEEDAAMELGVQLMQEIEGDLLLATDPDTDRVGAVVRQGGVAEALTGNQIACICLYHLLESGKVPENGAFVKTIVTSELFSKIAESYGKPCFDVLTGFKYIAELIARWEEEGTYRFVFGGEESYGYLLGTHARDKDAVVSCTLIAEAALWAKRQGLTLVDLLHQIYARFGVFREHLKSWRFPETKEGRLAMETAVESLRDEPPFKIAGLDVVELEDYLKGSKRELKSGSVRDLDLPKSNVLRFWLADGTKVVIRPSGTEPKVKLYCGTLEPGTTDVETDIQRADSRAFAIMEELEKKAGVE